MGKIYDNLITTTAGFKYPAYQPLDDREVVQSYSDLDGLFSYEGMEVYVVDDQKAYRLTAEGWKATATEDTVPEAAPSDWAENDPNQSGYVLNRTHYETVDTIEWDGKAVSGKASFTISIGGVGTTFYKLYDVALTKEQMVNAHIAYTEFDITKILTVEPPLYIWSLDSNDKVYAFITDSLAGMISAKEAGAYTFVFSGQTLTANIPSPGFYLSSSNYGGVQGRYSVLSCSYPLEVKTINAQYMPEDYPKMEVAGYKYETLTWNGEIGAKASSGWYVKITDQIFTMEQMSNAQFVAGGKKFIVQQGKEYDGVIICPGAPGYYVMAQDPTSGAYTAAVLSLREAGTYTITVNNNTAARYTFPAPGTYFLRNSTTSYVSAFTYPVARKYKVAIDNLPLPVADWNENDETAPGYIENRTHWVEPASTYFKPITWDGKIKDAEWFISTSNLPKWIKVSDQVLTKEQLENATFKYHNTSIFDRQRSMPSNNQIVLPSGWSFLARSATDYDSSYVMNTLYPWNSTTPTSGNSGESWILNPSIPRTSEEIAEGLSAWFASPRIPYNTRGDRSDSHGAWLGLAPNANWNISQCYTAQYDGTIDITINELINLSASASQDTKYLAVFHNGAMIWPTTNGAYDDTSLWQSADTLDIATADFTRLKNISVAINDKIELIAKGTESFDAVYVGLTIDYQEIKESMPIHTIESSRNDQCLVIRDIMVASIGVMGHYPAVGAIVPMAGTYVYNNDITITSIEPAEGSLVYHKIAKNFLPDDLVTGDSVGSITTGSANGTIAVDGTDVAVKGLKSAAYAEAGTFAKTEAVNNLSTTVSTLSNNVSTLSEKVDTLVGDDTGKSVRAIAQEVTNSTTVEINSISTDDIDNLFS